MNTRLEYLYRSPSNVREWGTVVFSGVPKDDTIRRLLAAMEGHEFFIANQVRVPELFFYDGLELEDDHCWHEFAALEPTSEEPTDEFGRTIESFVAECEAASRAGWQVFDPLRREPKRS